MAAPSPSASRTLDLPFVVEVCARAGLLTDAQADDVLLRAEPRRQRLVRERAQRSGGNDDPPSHAEVVAAFRFVLPDGDLLTEDRVMGAVAAAAGVPFVRIDPLRVDARIVTSTTTWPYARRHVVLPLQRDAKRLIVAVDDPFANEVCEGLKVHTGLDVELVVAARSDILRIAREVFSFRASLSQAAAELGDAAVDFGNLEQLVQLGASVDSEDRHVVNAVDFLLRYALDQGASDIHLEPKRETALVRLRIDGVLHTVQRIPAVVHPAIISRIKTMARLDIAEKRRPQDGRVKTQHGGREVELRISTLPVAFGEKVVIRIFDPEILLCDLAALGFFPKELGTFEGFIRRPNGILLVTGPTGSGKTTTLYSALRVVASPQVNVTTIEDPIEMVVEDFNQTAVYPKIGITFASALRTLLRQDPDVLMVGEIRDKETADNAIQAAMTGHLVLSTLHTNDAASSISRLIDLGAQPFLLASTLIGVVAQRLLRRVCVKCRYETELRPEQAEALGLRIGAGEKFPIYAGGGCPHCRETGLKGRVGIFEVMPCRRRSASSSSLGPTR